jgi:hypothetical protein
VSLALQLCPAFCQTSYSLSAQLYLSVQLQSALAYSFMHFICCERPAARNQLSFEVQGSFAICHLSCKFLLSHDLSAWQQSVNAVCQSSLSAQLPYVSSAAPCWLVSSAATFWLSCSLSSFGLCPLVAMNADICKRQSDEACNNYAAHCYDPCHP